MNGFRFLLKPSLIPRAGIGCFSCQAIQRGEQLSPGYEENFRHLRESDIPDEYLKFCVLMPVGSYLSPENFLRMGVFWYINHAKLPNLIFKRSRLFAKRTIIPGEELTLYYSDLLTHPKNKLWVTTHDV